MGVVAAEPPGVPLPDKPNTSLFTAPSIVILLNLLFAPPKEFPFA
jgi:hypothetical protein